MKICATLLLTATLLGCQPSPPEGSTAGRVRTIGQELRLNRPVEGFASYGNLSFTHMATVDPPEGLQATDFAAIGSDRMIVSYMSAGQALAGGVDLLDFSRPSTPAILWSWATDTREYSRVLVLEDRYAYLFGASPNGGVVTVLDLAGAPTTVAELELGGHFATSADFADDAGKIYVAVGDSLGIVELDVAAPAQPVVAAVYPLANPISTLGAICLGGDQHTALYRMTPSGISHLATVSSTPTEAPAVLAASGSYLFTNAGKSGLTVVSSADGRIVHQSALPGRGNGIRIAGGFALLAQGDGGTRLHNICDVSAPEHVGSFDIDDDGGSANRVAYAAIGGQHLLLLADGFGGFRVVRADPSTLLKAKKSYVAAEASKKARMPLFQPRNVKVPRSVRVTRGNAGNGRAKLHFDAIECNYDGAGGGSRYDLRDCSDGSGAESEILAVCEIALTVVDADAGAGETEVEVELRDAF